MLSRNIIWRQLLTGKVGIKLGGSRRFYPIFKLFLEIIGVPRSGHPDVVYS